MRTILGTAIGVAVLFLIVLLVASGYSDPRISSSEAFQFALQWTLHATGGMTAVVSAAGMLFIAATHGPFERQIAMVLPLLGGLLVFSPNWGLALSLGAIVVTWLLREVVWRKPGGSE